jgi:hypothetical protein
MSILVDIKTKNEKKRQTILFSFFLNVKLCFHPEKTVNVFSIDINITQILTLTRKSFVDIDPELKAN